MPGQHSGSSVTQPEVASQRIMALRPRASETAAQRRGSLLLLARGLRFGAAWVQGKQALGVPAREFAGALCRGSRPHFFVYSAAATLAGAGAARGHELRVGLAALSAAFAWGVGQLLNDLSDLEGDSVDAPDRPAVQGLLPDGPTSLVVACGGLLVTLAFALLHPFGVLLAFGSGLLLLVYSAAKRWPLLGNVAHGALMALLGVIGGAMASPTEPLPAVFAQSAGSAALLGGVGALYLQGNYEKDRVGDARAGNRTLSHVLGIRGSAALRAVGAILLFVAAVRLGHVSSSLALSVLTGSLALHLVSALVAFRGGTDGAALRGYRASVHAAALAYLALGSAFLGDVGLAVAVVSSAAVIEVAFARSANP